MTNKKKDLKGKVIPLFAILMGLGAGTGMWWASGNIPIGIAVGLGAIFLFLCTFYRS